MRMRIIWEVEGFTDGLMRATAAFDEGAQKGLEKAIMRFKVDGYIADL